MIKILIGGSPCVFWSVAQKAETRETEASGEGWELFKNYLIAKEKFKPDFFLYENNKSVSKAIKGQISEKLGVDLMHINSALVSAQQRQRFYAFNWEVDQPEDRNLQFQDILTSGYTYQEKAWCLTANYSGAVPPDFFKSVRSQVFEKSDEPTKQFVQDGILTIRHNSTRSNRQTIKVGNKLADGFYTLRKMTPIECERLQTLPDGYTDGISNTQRYRSLGNGWTAEVIIHILQGALKDVPKDEEIVVLSMYDGIATGRYCLDKMGFTNVKYYAHEIDKYAMQVASNNYPDIIHMGDAYNVRQDDWCLQ